MIENKTLETLYPKLYRDYIETRVKQDEQLRDQGLNLSRTGPAQFEYSPCHMEPQKSLKTSMPSLSGTLTTEIPDDVLRARACYTHVP